MNKKETLLLMSCLRAAYPMFYRDMGEDDIEGTVKLWYSLFAADDFKLVQAATLALIGSRTSTYPPVPGEVKAKMHSLLHPEQETAAEAWALVAKAIRNGVYGSQEEFDKLPHSIQKLVGSPNQIREWAMMDAGEVATVVASNFQRSYKTRQENDKEMDMLPPAVKSTVSQFLSQMPQMPEIESADVKPSGILGNAEHEAIRKLLEVRAV